MRRLLLMALLVGGVLLVLDAAPSAATSLLASAETDAAGEHGHGAHGAGSWAARFFAAGPVAAVFTILCVAMVVANRRANAIVRRRPPA